MSSTEKSSTHWDYSTVLVSCCLYYQGTDSKRARIVGYFSFCLSQTYDLDWKTSSNTLIQFKAFSNIKEECIQSIQRDKQKFQNTLQDTVDKKCRHLDERQSELSSYSSPPLTLAFGTLNTSLHNKNTMDCVNMSETSNGY